VTSLTTANMYLCANALLIVAVAMLSILQNISRRLQHPLAYRQLLWIGYGASVAALLLPLICAFVSHDVMPYTLQVWSAPSMRSVETMVTDPRVAIPSNLTNASVPLSIVEMIAPILVCTGILVFLFRLVLDASAISRILLGAQTMRRHHGSRLLVSDRVQVPFSFWFPGARIVVIPFALLLQSDELRLAIRHEIQHHRQHDTQWLYLYLLLKALFFWNPAVHLLARRIQELQEFACDAAVIARRDVSAKSYCHALVLVAEQSECAFSQQLSVSMLGSSNRKLLKQRVSALLTQPVQYLPNAWVVFMSIIAMTVMSLIATVSATTIHDRRISLDDATRMAAMAPTGGIPVVVNEAVVKQLNRLLGTPDGRTYLRACLNRMRQHEAMITEKITKIGLPIDLLAVPLVESGYRNLQSRNARSGAGLWMFISPAARRFGLAVNDHHDERLDTVAATDAALRMLTMLHSRYEDWGLALLAYNSGSVRVDRGISETNSREVWTLIEKGYENDPDYVARVMAVILILRTPSALN